MKEYQLFMTPEYGPRTSALPPQCPVDFSNPDVSRRRHNDFYISVNRKMLRDSGFEDEVMSVGSKDLQTDSGIPVRFYSLNEEQRPLAVYFHGGSFSANNIDVMDIFSRVLCRYGAVNVLSVEYRLAPEHPFPNGLEDCYSALCWAESNAKTLYASGRGLFVVGDSSGGNFAAVSAILARDRKGPKITGQILIFPVTALQPTKKTRSEILYGEKHGLDYDSSVVPFRNYITSESEKNNVYVSPLFSDNLVGLPPALFLQAGCDPLLDQGLQYAQALYESGVKVSCKIFEGMLHGFILRNYPQVIELAQDIAVFVELTE